MAKQNTMLGLKQYIASLQSHDWHYSYSDDHGIYVNGSTERQELKNMAAIYDHNYQIWDSIAPDQYKQGAY